MKNKHIAITCGVILVFIACCILTAAVCYIGYIGFLGLAGGQGFQTY